MALFDDLVRHTGAEIDRQGWAHIQCPECGHDSIPKRPHCSFGQTKTGAWLWHCFVCGKTGSLKNLAELVKLDTGDYDAPKKPQEARRAPKKEYSWLGNPEPILSAYEAAHGRFERWQAYKPLSRETIERARLGLGVLPSSKCHHQRLIVPVIDGTMVVGLRGRWLGCSCDPKSTKWLVAGGTVLENLPLYGEEDLKPGAVVWVVENCADAKLITQETPYIGVAMYATGYWRQAWVDTLLRYRPELVVMCLDNDLVGNGGAERRQEFIRMWKEKHHTDKIPEANGPKRVNEMVKAGLPAILYPWGKAEHKADVGSMIAGYKNV